MYDYVDDVNTEDIFNSEQKPAYVSPLGDFNFTQERLLLFGSGWKIIVVLSIFLVSLASSVFAFFLFLDVIDLIDVGFNLRYFLVLYVLGILLSQIVPVGVLLMFIGAKGRDINKAAKGLKVLTVYYKVLRAILIISGILCAISLFILLFFVTLFAIVAGLIFGVLYFVLIKYYNALVEFLMLINLNIVGRREKLPNPDTIINFLIFFLVLNVISFALSSMGTSTGDFTAGTGSVYQDIIDAISQSSTSPIAEWLQIGFSAFTLFLVYSYKKECFLAPPPRV